LRGHKFTYLLNIQWCC